MSLVEVRDVVIWACHIHGNEPLKDKLTTLPAGELINLIVDGRRGVWKKMADGKDGRPTAGINGVGPAREHWHAMFEERRGELVSIQEAP